MMDGVQRAISCEFEIKGPSTTPTAGETSSKWKLALDLEDVEPAITVHKISPTDKTIYFRLSVQAMKSASETTDVISKFVLTMIMIIMRFFQEHLEFCGFRGMYMYTDIVSAEDLLFQFPFFCFLFRPSKCQAVLRFRRIWWR